MRFHHIWRRLMRTPVFTILTVATLALGIGANAAIFSVIEAVLLKPLPFPHSEELIGVWHSATGINIPELNMAPSLYFTYREQNRTLRDIGMWNTFTVSITGLPQPEEVNCLSVTDGTLPLLGVTPAMGRLFSRSDDVPGSPRTAIVTYGYWQAKFGGEASAVGRNILIDGNQHQIIGVLPKSFHFLDYKADLLTPMRFDRAKVVLGNFSYQGVARLKPGATLAQANADIGRLIPVSMNSFPPPPGFNAKLFQQAGIAPKLRPFKTDLIGDIGETLWVLMGTIGLVLLIACANVANLLLVRADGRQQELAIRAALGAGWTEIARELMLESLTLGLMGGAAGIGLAYAALKLLVAMAPANLPRVEDISIDAPVLLFTLAISLIAGSLFGAIPVIKYAGPHLAGALRGGGRTNSQSRERHRARNILVVVQVALALVLLIGSGLMIRTFQALRHVNPGFTHPEQLQTMRIAIPEAQVKDSLAGAHMYQNLLDKVAAIPGVSSVALTSVLPMSSSGWHDLAYAEDRVYGEAQIPPIRSFHFLSPGAPQTFGNSFVAGRDLTWTDIYQKRPVILVSENLARELWKTPEAALGKRLRESTKTAWREVVGVVKDMREDGVDHKPPSVVYFPMLLDNFEAGDNYLYRSLNFVIRTPRAGSDAFMNEVRTAVWSINQNLPLAAVNTMGRLYDKSMARTSFMLVMLAIAGAMALVLGMVGIYGVISYTVSQRTREIGIRMALGARRQTLTGMFLRQSLRLTAIGVACGLVAAAALTRLMTSMLFEVKPADPVTYIAVSAGLVLAALLASYVPALRATGVNPMEALRAD